ncbi:hypothetical protein QT979_08535 [Microcoleus sp. w2-18bC1]|uniref:hypothetical protein n=1 Tax=unclassified Microcoleus TaxID=2642155 RepID=UPI002FD1C593
MYTPENLQQKNLKELKEIGWELNILPDGDRRCRQNWIDALVGKNPPLLQLLEDSPVVEVESVQEPIEIQRQEPIESKFGRIVYPKASIKPIAQTAIETISDVESRPASADFHHSLTPAAESDGDSSSNEAASLGSQTGDRVLALARNSEGNKGRALLDRSDELAAETSPGVKVETTDRFVFIGSKRFRVIEPVMQEAVDMKTFGEPDYPDWPEGWLPTTDELAATFNDERPPNRGDGKGRIEPKVSQSAIDFCASPLTFSPRFLATYPPYFGEIHYKAEATGQLNLLEPETDSEPPDPDDFASIDAFNEALARWDAENPEPLAASMDSMCEWAPCPADWYEPEAEILPLKASSMNELAPSAESSSTCNFSIPTFDAWCDRANRQTDSDKPPDTGSFTRLPGPKPPKFPPMAIGQSHTKRIPNADQAQVNHISITPESHTGHIAAAGSSRLGRSPPGGDVM